MNMDNVTITRNGKYFVFSWRSKKFFCQLVRDVQPHEDHLVLSALLAFSHYFRDRGASFSIPISERFKSQLESSGRWRLEFANGSVEPYSGDRPGLSYSTGVDSTAAAFLLGQCSAFYLTDRDKLYKNFVLEAIGRVREFGVDARTVHCNVQSVRSPFGFPVDVACAIPCIVNAAAYSLDSIAFGSILESTYNIGRGRYMDYSQGHHFLFWGGLFSSVGLPFNQVTAGLSEVATLNIQMQSGLLGKSCMRSNVECGRCYKCLRRSVIRGDVVPITEALRRAILTRHHYDIFEYGKYKHGLNIVSAPLKDMRFLERWYAKSVELLPDKYKDTVAKRITEVGEMDDVDVQNLISYKRG
jgi:hypothetical protein